jgi:5-methyltetrahydrofolate--homocysteine methyltransferase
VLTQPRRHRGHPRAYLEAGADIIETNTFNGTRIAMADYGMQERPARSTSPRRASPAKRRRRGTSPGKPRFVAGVLGPTNRTASISPDVNDPGYRNVTSTSWSTAYAEQAAG